MKLIESLAIHISYNPFRWLFGIFVGGFLFGILTVVLIHFIWVKTVFQDQFKDQLERELSKKLAYYVYEQRTCVAKWRTTKDCVEWMK